MDPLPPADGELLIIIDKLAVFVARNGPEFEEMTKSKQKNNPKFAFLFGGEYYEYYTWKVTCQQKALGHPEPGWPPPTPAPTAAAPAVATDDVEEQIKTLEGQQKALSDQIRESESNLRAQEEVSEGQMSNASAEAVSKGRYERLELLAADTGLTLEEMSHVFQPIIDSCTKDSISSGKSWIFSNASSHDKNQLIAHYLSYRVTQEDVPFLTRLHLIYLMNDVLHHCIRKNAEELKHSLESVAVEMFSAAALHANEEQTLKLNKLINLWESKAIFSGSTLSKMRAPQESWNSYKEELLEDYKSEVTRATEAFKNTLENYKAQHTNFLSHANSNIQSLSLQIESLREQSEEKSRMTRPPEYNQPPHSEEGSLFPPVDYDYPPPTWSQQEEGPHPGALARSTPRKSAFRAPAHSPRPLPPPAGLQSILASPWDPCLPPHQTPPPSLLNTLPPIMEDKSLQPSMPYYDLPAGLMVPLVHLEDADYKKPLDPAKIRLPPPAPTTERLMAAVEAFYSQPSHESPRDLDGFEILGLFEFSKEKNAALEQKKADILSGLRLESPPPATESPEPWPMTPSPEPHRRKPEKKERKRRSYRSRTRSRSGSRESTPERRLRRSTSPYLTKRSPSPPLRGKRRRSPESPVSIDSSNKGHQMMQRMGWKSGTGLGSSETGIVEPISGGEVRERKETYKGVGFSNSDPFEAFRKNKAGSYYTRMKERSDFRK
ncbi:Calcium homeostasis endoplasmic reticulum proteinlike [Caligus rogercresseyi]|uniref:Calcium homeostasis endoplasmic reticulum proteinlike n=1 Tax=Caligus rogercresseyi TaxID=217165 RepID=A0A7T8QVQ7_CALRO|nr:Calcium homeostasis endoplasmic reticulum proteinlike [Caligus rogercresseyi]